jgi:pilus assembly protein CpaF
MLLVDKLDKRGRPKRPGPAGSGSAAKGAEELPPNPVSLSAALTPPGRQQLASKIPLEKVKHDIHSELIQSLDPNADQWSAAEVNQKIAELVEAYCERGTIRLPRSDRQVLADLISHDVLGLGPLEQLLNDPEISEIMVNGHDTVFVERRGRLSQIASGFESDKQLRRVIDRIVSSIGRRIDESRPMVDARLADGSRVNVIIPPLAVGGPSVTIRKFARQHYTADDLIQFGTINAEMVHFIRACVRARVSLVISGGTGSGKTTTLNVLSNFIPDNERVVTIEDTAELQLHHRNMVRLEARPSNVEGRGQVTIRDLVVNALRMRPDRIVVGECRAGEALDMLQAMNTGHDGSMTTIHANTPKDAMGRLETMVIMAGSDLPYQAIREQIVGGVSMVVHQSRLRDGRRCLTHISEITGLDGTRILMQDICRFEQTGIDAEGNVLGYFRWTGVVPQLLGKLKANGEDISLEMFGGQGLQVLPGQATAGDADPRAQALD